MPISPQITITPEDITFKSFDISAVTYTSTTATYTAIGHTFSPGDIVIITGLVPDDYNGTYTITAIATNTFTVNNTANLVVTDPLGNAYWSDPNEYEYDGGQTVVYIPDTASLVDEVTGIIAIDPTVNSKAQTYYALTPPTNPPYKLNAGDLWFDTDDNNKQYRYDGANWISVQDGTIATKNRTYYSGTAPTGTFTVGDIWFDTNTGNKPYRWNGSSWISVQDASIATALSAANAAQTTANGKNKVTYSLSAASGSGTAAGDIWWQYNSSGVIIAQWEWNGSSWVSKTIGNQVIASIDAGKITAGTISVAISLEAATITGGSININSGTFVVTSAGAVTITAGSFNINSGTFQVSNAGVITATAGTIGGWNLGASSISKTVGTKTLTLDSTNAIMTIADSSSGILSGGGINMSAGSATGTYGANGFSYNGNMSIRADGSDLYLQGGATSSIRLAPGAGLGSTTYWVQIEGHLNSAAYTLSTGTWSDSSTATSTGTYLSSSGAIIARRSNQIPMFAHRYSTSGTSEMIRLVYNGSDAGGITTTSGGVPAFRNASDYRLKSDIQDFTNAADIIKALRLRSFKYNVEPDKTAVGFIAHEMQQVLPDLVLGQKDAVDEEGNPAYQSITATNLIPYLTGALKEAILRIEKLEKGN